MGTRVPTTATRAPSVPLLSPLGAHTIPHRHWRGAGAVEIPNWSEGTVFAAIPGSIQALMKTFCSWLLVLIAVLVPATAAVMAPVFSPPTSAAKQVQSQTHAGKARVKHGQAKALSAATYTVAKAGGHDRRSSDKAHLENCSDCGPCNLCSACGPAGAMVASNVGPVLSGWATERLVPQPESGRAQLVSGGQYRPPRSA